MFAKPELHAVEAEVKATWMELFFDLAYVAAIAVVAHEFAKHVSWQGLLDFLLLFVVIIFSWGKFTFYAGRFKTDDTFHRVAMLVQMVGVAGMGISAHHGFEDGIHGFALGYVVTVAVLFVVLGRAWLHYPEKRALNAIYLAGTPFITGLWIAVYFVPEHAYLLVGIALAIDLITPVIAARFQHLHPLNEAHFPERFGLFSIIVLGEIVAGAVRGGTKAELTEELFLIGFMGMLVAFAFWWLYFENVRGTSIQNRQGMLEFWAYAHMPWVIGVVLLGIGIEFCIAHDQLSLAELRVLYGSCALSLLFLGIIQLVSAKHGDRREPPLQTIPKFLGAGVAAVLAFIAPLTHALPVLATLAAIPLLVIVYDTIAKRRNTK